MTIQYDPRLGAYRGDKGRIIPKSQIERLLRDEQRSLNNDLQRLYRNYQGRGLTILQLQQRSAELIRAKSIELGLLAVGGKAQLNEASYKQQIYGQIGRNVRNGLEALQRNIVAIANGEISPRMAAFRFKQIAASAAIGHYAIEKTAREHEGFNFGARSLEPGAKHCKSCPSYSTDGLFVPIEQIITPGRLCECGGFCKCRVKYKKDYRDQPTVKIPDEKFAAQNYEKLGEGAYGTVYRNGDIVYKYLKTDRYTPMSGLNASNEVKLTQRASDLGVAPRILGSTRTAYAAEYLKGFRTFADVDDLSKLNGGNAAVSNFVQSMRRLHENGIAHLDAHQFNVMVNDRGQVRLIDFGMASDGNQYDVLQDLNRMSRRWWIRDTVDGQNAVDLLENFVNNEYANPNPGSFKNRLSDLYDQIEQLNLRPIPRLPGEFGFDIASPSYERLT